MKLKFLHKILKIHSKLFIFGNIPQVSLFTFAIIATALAAPLDESKDAQIISADSEQSLNGYRFR